MEIGEVVSCTFINVPPNTIAVKKVVDPVSQDKFEFYGSLNGTIGHNQYIVKPRIEPSGEYLSVREKPINHGNWIQLSARNPAQSGR